MFEAQEDGAVVEDELTVILKTALGVGDLAVSDLFRAIDCQGKGKITFGKTFYWHCLVMSDFLCVCVNKNLNL